MKRAIGGTERELRDIAAGRTREPNDVGSAMPYHMAVEGFGASMSVVQTLLDSGQGHLVDRRHRTDRHHAKPANCHEPRANNHALNGGPSAVINNVVDFMIAQVSCAKATTSTGSDDLQNTKARSTKRVQHVSFCCIGRSMLTGKAVNSGLAARRGREKV